MNLQRGCEVMDVLAYDIDWIADVRHCGGKGN